MKYTKGRVFMFSSKLFGDKFERNVIVSRNFFVKRNCRRGNVYYGRYGHNYKAYLRKYIKAMYRDCMKGYIGWREYMEP